MPILFIGIVSCAAGAIQCITGFGSAIVLMIFLPQFLNMLEAPAVTAAICLSGNVYLALKFRKQVDIRHICRVAISYLLFSINAILIAVDTDVAKLRILLGGIFVAIALFYLIKPPEGTIKRSWYAELLIGSFSGICSGLFGIGGPLVALYCMSTTESREEYLGSAQMIFALTGLANMMTRISNGIYSLALFPAIFAGIAGLYIGDAIGMKISSIVNAETVKKMTYIFVGISGIITIIQSAV